MASLGVPVVRLFPVREVGRFPTLLRYGCEGSIPSDAARISL